MDRNIDETVMSSGDASRNYFKNNGLTYSNITEGDILVLIMLLNKHIKISNKNNETSVSTMRLSEKIDKNFTSSGKMKSCFLYMNSHYFTERECISFNADGFIGFAGWADKGNLNPIIRAFIEWCDILKNGE